MQGGSYEFILHIVDNVMFPIRRRAFCFYDRTVQTRHLCDIVFPVLEGCDGFQRLGTSHIVPVNYTIDVVGLGEGQGRIKQDIWN